MNKAKTIKPMTIFFIGLLDDFVNTLQIQPKKESSIPATTKSPTLQLTPLVNCMAIKGSNKIKNVPRKTI